MQGDFSRGHRPDRKRGDVYLRALAQERRLLLDSDLNAATDALHERLRELANHLGCPKGSPDLGFLVTPGRLLALFEELDDVIVSSANLTLHKDHQTKYLDRYPSLHLVADQGGQGTVTLRLRESFNGQVHVWCRRDAAATVTFGGAALAVPQNADLQAVAASVNGQTVVVTVDNGGEIWIGLIETLHNATAAPEFHYAGGCYYLDGLPLRNPADVMWTTPAVPPGNFQFNNLNLAVDDRVLAYLEGWERHVTYVEDLGLLEHALGGDTDTMTRGRAIGQVKLAFVPGTFDLESFARALAAPVQPLGTLEVTTPPAPPNPDPCALPVQGGYTGADNRFYRFEVHTGGALGTAVFKWSRDNGSELFAVSNAATNAELTFPSNTPLQGGDLVEVLTADSIDLGDEAPALLDGAADTFTPPVRAVGVLARLVGPDVNGAFTMTGTNGLGVVTLPAHYGPFPTQTLKVRRWHGLIETTAAPVPNDVEVENGLRVELDGTFVPGDYWQYEARASTSNVNGPFVLAPHGPERDFAPLALLRYQGVNQPLLLERWLDDRFSPLCELTADDIAFDGDHIGSDSDTVQEVIEELWERSGGGCCDLTLEPPQGDAAAPIRDFLQGTQGEVTICLEPGVYPFSSTLEIANRTVILKGCPRAVIAGAGGVNPVFAVTGTGRLVLENVVVLARQSDGTRVLIAVADTALGVEARDAALIVVPAAGVNQPAIAIQVGGVEPPPVNPAFSNPPQPPQFDEAGPSIRLLRVVSAATWAIAASDPRSVRIADSVLRCAIGCVFMRLTSILEVRSSLLFAGTPLTDLQAWTADALLSGRDSLFAPLGSIVVQVPNPESVCIWAAAVTNGVVAANFFLGGVNVAVTEAQFLDLHHNRLGSTHTALHIVEAQACSMHDESVLGLNAQLGLAVRAADGLSIAGCAISGFDLGIGLGTVATAAERSFRNVQVVGNRLDDVRIGIQAGPPTSSVYTGELAQVALAENTVRASQVGIVVNALAIGGPNAPALTVRPAAVRVADNVVTARLGIGAVGRGVEIADNVVRPVPVQGSAFFGIAGVLTTGFVCSGNVIEVAQGVSLPVAGGGTPAFMSSLASANVQPAAIVLSGGAEARVAGNTARADAGISMRALSADAHPRLSVKGNELLCGPSFCQDTDDIVFLDNTSIGTVRISSAVGGQVADNRVRENVPLKLEGDLEILLASGRWKVADNRTDGAIRILPSTTGGGFFPWLVDVGSYTVGNWRALDTIGVLSGDSQFVEIINQPPPGPITQPIAAAEQPADAPIAISYAMSNTNWSAGYAEAMESFVNVGISRDLFDVIDIGDVIIVRGQREVEYHVQCTSNWARDIEIGIFASSVAMSSASILQVVSNRADEEIAVRSYARLVLALNIAASYRVPGTAQPGAITQPNLDV